VKIALLSDLHANGDALAAVVRELERRRPDRVFHLGDLVGYNAEPEICVRWAMTSTNGGVSGNHDAVACGRTHGENFPAAARIAALWSRDHLSGASREFLAGLPARLDVEGGPILVHGAPGNPDRYIYSAAQAAEELASPPLSDALGPVFFGHTHVAGGFVRRENGVVEPVPPKTVRLRDGERALLNPGSVGQPRDRNPDASFLLFDTDTREATWVHVPYDVEGARAKVLAAGLPSVFADRLRDGM
jgi:diadenosine tetraphosphatase ApaH/serine/threonine PP2A family protein phosphatase